jgi:hypothetical protein
MPWEFRVVVLGSHHRIVVQQPHEASKGEIVIPHVVVGDNDPLV